jgi:hypothetical protein
MITEKQYCDITNCTPWFNLESFKLDEVQAFLTKLGYKIVIHEAPWIKEVVEWDAMEPVKKGKEQFFDPRILAVKEGESLPERNDSEKAMKMDFRHVFQTELKKRILGL